MQPIDLDNAFTYHPPRNDADVADHQAVREAGKALAVTVDRLCPDGPEKSLAIRKVQEAVMWANAGLACGRGHMG